MPLSELITPDAAPAPTPAAPTNITGEDIARVLQNPGISYQQKAPLLALLQKMGEMGTKTNFLGIQTGGASNNEQLGTLNYLLNNNPGDFFSGIKQLFETSAAPQPQIAQAMTQAAAPAAAQEVQKAKPPEGPSWTEGAVDAEPVWTGGPNKDAAKPGVVQEGQAQTAFSPLSRINDRTPLFGGLTPGATPRGLALGRQETTPFLAPGTPNTQSSTYEMMMSKYRKLKGNQPTNNKPMGVADTGNQMQLNPLQG